MCNWTQHDDKHGYACPIEVLGEADAQSTRRQLEAVETRIGNDGELRKLVRVYPHTVLPFLDDLVSPPAITHRVQQILGDNRLVWNARVQESILLAGVPAHA